MNDLIATSKKKPKIIFTNASRKGQHYFLPMVYAHIRTWCDTFPHLKDGFEWHKPFYHILDHPDVFYDFIGEETFDIVGLSCYVWNLKMNEIIVKKVREMNPNCMIVLGGPGVSWYDDDIFEQFPDADIIVKGEGEVPFQRILEEYQKDHNWASVPSIIYKGENGERIETSGIYRHYPKDEDPSPVLYMKDYFEDELDNWQFWDEYWGDPSIVWDTNKGCPYKCTFCEIATDANNKVVKYSWERVLEEAEWVISSRLRRVIIGDSNFGMLQRDEDLVDEMVKMHDKYGVTSKKYSITSAKSHGDRVGRIYVKLLQYDWGRRGRVCGQTLLYDIQTQTEESLEAMRRYTIKAPEREKVVTQLLQDGFMPVPALILGCPGETNESWVRSVTGIPEWRMHYDWYLHPWLQLPNAPSSAPEYEAEYQIQTIDRYAKDARPEKYVQNDLIMARAPYQVANKDMTREDYGFRALFWGFVSAFHTYGLVHYVALYLRHTHQISYYDFYTDLFDAFDKMPEGGKICEEVRDHYRDFMTNPECTYQMDVDPQHPRVAEPEEYIYIHAGNRARPEIYGYLRERYKHLENINSIVDFQEFAIITPWHAELEGDFDHLWKSYFQELEGSCYLKDPMPEPTAQRVRLRLNDTSEAWDELRECIATGQDSKFMYGHNSFFIMRIFWYGGSAKHSSSYMHYKDITETLL